METESMMRETCKIKHDITIEIESRPTQHKHRCIEIMSLLACPTPMPETPVQVPLGMGRVVPVTFV